METTAKQQISGFAQSLAQLIESAPAGESQAAGIQTPSGPSYVLASSGWGDRYIQKIELRGKEWLAAFESACPVIASGGIVAMIGDRGPGKTQMAAELARLGDWKPDRKQFTRGDGLIVHQSKTALYRRAMDIFMELAHVRKNHVKSSEKEVLDRLGDVGLLVIDEFQERPETEYTSRALSNMLDKRYASSRPTIVIANLTRKEMFSALGASIVNRARENGKSIEFNWPSYRVQP